MNQHSLSNKKGKARLCKRKTLLFMTLVWQQIATERSLQVKPTHNHNNGPL